MAPQFRGRPLSVMCIFMALATLGLLPILDQILSFHATPRLQLTLDAVLVLWFCVLMGMFLSAHASGKGGVRLWHIYGLMVWLMSLMGCTAMSIQQMWQAHGRWVEHFEAPTDRQASEEVPH